MLCGQVQVRAALVLVVWVAQVVGIVADDALHERQVVQQDGATQAPRYINPARGQRLLLYMRCMYIWVHSTYMSMTANHG